MKQEYSIFCYQEMESEKPDHKFSATGKRELYGILKTIIDNFNPAHIDIINDHKFKDKSQTYTNVRKPKDL